MISTVSINEDDRTTISRADEKIELIIIRLDGFFDENMKRMYQIDPSYTCEVIDELTTIREQLHSIIQGDSLDESIHGVINSLVSTEILLSNGRVGNDLEEEILRIIAMLCMIRLSLSKIIAIDDTREEISAVENLLNTESLLGEKVVEESVVSGLQNPRPLVHLAAHGVELGKRMGKYSSRCGI